MVPDLIVLGQRRPIVAALAVLLLPPSSLPLPPRLPVPTPGNDLVPQFSGALSTVHRLIKLAAKSDRVKSVAPQHTTIRCPPSTSHLPAQFPGEAREKSVDRAAPRAQPAKQARHGLWIGHLIRYFGRLRCT